MNNAPLKMMAFKAALAVMQAAAPLQAAVTISSVQHRVWGSAGSTTYDQTASSPLTQSVTEGTNQASSTASDWAINAYASNSNAFEAVAYAQNTYIITPSTFPREISIALNGVIGVWWFDNSAKMELKNLTSNSLVSRSPHRRRRRCRARSRTAGCVRPGRKRPGAAPACPAAGRRRTS